MGEMTQNFDQKTWREETIWNT